jgi:hypothetical protein
MPAAWRRVFTQKKGVTPFEPFIKILWLWILAFFLWESYSLFRNIPNNDLHLRFFVVKKACKKNAPLLLSFTAFRLVKGTFRGPPSVAGPKTRSVLFSFKDRAKEKRTKRENVVCSIRRISNVDLKLNSKTWILTSFLAKKESGIRKQRIRIIHFNLIL